ncbi:hypothetical protein PVAP13_8KG307500 [Panicum virgatum]|uniref:Uncharacterized protein n=1 Tax=Panicum virgatum TaxID=38727 RepID=A0A8T0PM21_PANVG|nr:hypothetical protein PVAP13_8KG307500 [Panicum virgatum]
MLVLFQRCARRSIPCCKRGRRPTRSWELTIKLAAINASAPAICDHILGEQPANLATPPVRCQTTRPEANLQVRRIASKSRLDPAWGQGGTSPPTLGTPWKEENRGWRRGGTNGEMKKKKRGVAIRSCGGSCVGDDCTMWVKVLDLVASLSGVATNTAVE